MKKLTTLLTLCMLLIAQPAFSLDLHSAKSQGLVGELSSGYLGAVKAPSTEVKALITEVNAKRKKAYMKIATSNKLTLKAVEELAGEKAIKKSAAGSYIKDSSGWKKK